MFTASLLALFCVLGAMILVALVVTIGFQACFGGFASIPLHVIQLYFGIHFINVATYGIVGVAIYSMVGKNVVGHILILTITALPALILAVLFDDLGKWRILVFGLIPRWDYSGAQGFLPSLVDIRWLQAYWLLGAISLAILSVSLRPSSGESSIFRRVLRLPLNSTGLQRIAFAIAFASFLAFGFRNYMQLSIEDKQYDKALVSNRWAKYELAFKRYESEPLPIITKASIDYQIDTKSRSVNIVGKYTLDNESSFPIYSLLVRTPFKGIVGRADLRLDGTPVTQEDSSVGTYVFTLDTPIYPGKKIFLDFNYTVRSQNVFYNASVMPVYDEGAYFEGNLLPLLGYEKSFELKSDQERGKHSLPPLASSDISKSKNSRPQLLNQQAALMPIDIYVFTDSNQIGITQGALVSSQSIDGRRSSHFRSETNISVNPTIVAGKYSVRSANWDGIDTEVYFNPQQRYNIDLILGATRDALNYANREFGRYRHSVIRIVQAPERPDFVGWAYETLIFISENSSYIARDPEDLDRLYFLIVHEIAHQWWGGRVVPKPWQPGAHAFSESLADYTAWMIYKKTHGYSKYQRRIYSSREGYFNGRASSKTPEMPLANDLSGIGAPHPNPIVYTKGLLALYALADEIGEAAMNRALAEIVKKYSNTSPPTLVFSDLLKELRKVTPQDAQHMISDLFESIITYDARATSATARDLGNGWWEVSGTLTLNKWRIDAARQTVDAAINDVIDIAVYGSKWQLLGFQKYRVHSNELNFKFAVQGLPARVRVNPWSKLLEENVDNNTLEVKFDHLCPWYLSELTCSDKWSPPSSCFCLQKN